MRERAKAPREQLVGIDRDGNVSLWFNRKLLEQGVEFHEEKKKNPPPRSLLIYGDGRRILDRVIVDVVATAAPTALTNALLWSDFASALDETIWRIFHEEFLSLPRQRFACETLGDAVGVKLLDIQVNRKQPQPD